MEINATASFEVEIDPLEFIESLKLHILGSSRRWVEKKDNGIYVMKDAYHNSSEVVKKISPEDMEYLEALGIVEKYLKTRE